MKEFKKSKIDDKCRTERDDYGHWYCSPVARPQNPHEHWHEHQGRNRVPKIGHQNNIAQKKEETYDDMGVIMQGLFQSIP